MRSQWQVKKSCDRRELFCLPADATSGAAMRLTEEQVEQHQHNGRNAQ
jgi:hypothetical protein